MGVVDMCGYVRMWWICMGVMDVSVLVVHFVCTLTSEPRAAMPSQCRPKEGLTWNVATKGHPITRSRCSSAWSCDVKNGHAM